MLNVFYECSNLSAIVIPEDLKIIKKGLFNGCSALKTLTIPSSVEYIYQEAFANCNGLEEVIVLPQTPPFLYDNSFSNYDITLKVPDSAKDTYMTTSPWSKFTTFKTVSGEDLEKKKVEKPEINVVDGKLEFSCATEDVKYHWTITNANGTSGEGNSVPFKQSFTVSVYATKDGYENSDLTTKEFSGSGLVGDVNCDGVVNAADAVKLVDIIMGKE